VTTTEEPTLTDLLDLERIDRDLFRATTVFDGDYALYGGQVAAQALLAAGRTVDPERLPHSLHGYFLRGGDVSRATVFEVFRDRDGGSSSARRVVARQNGEVIFSKPASFARASEGPDVAQEPAPEAPDPDDLPAHEFPRTFSFDARAVPLGFDVELPQRFWTRCTAPLPADPLLHAAALTYVSDMYAAIPTGASAAGRAWSSLDHALWFHRPGRSDEWLLVDLEPRTAAGGRNWYVGTVHDRSGVLLASLAQEHLLKRP